MARFTLGPSRLARFFFHDCERHLRYHATPAKRAAAEGVPALTHAGSPVTAAILEGGYAWEEHVVTKHLGADAHVAKGAGPLRERTHSSDATLRLLRKLAVGSSIYQGSLVAPDAFYERYGLDRALVELPACRPDLVELVACDDGVARLRVVDVKASKALKASHRVQVALYALILRDLAPGAKLPHPIDLETGGVWLYLRDQPEWFSLSLTMGALERFLRERLTTILTSPADDVPWHLFFRCEWCEYYAPCRAEAERTRSVSLIPYLSVGGRAYLREASWGGAPVHTLADLAALVTGPHAGALDACGSLRGKQDRLGRIAATLEDGVPRPHGGSTVAMPQGEHVRVTLTLQSDPLSGEVYAIGYRRLFGKEVYGSPSDEIVLVAASPDDCARVQHGLLTRMHEDLRTLHAFNAGRPWKEQKSLQTYVFDGYERDLFHELLHGALDDPELAPLAMDLFFFYQDTSLARADEHPRAEVPYPIVVLTRVIRELVAVPSPIALRLSAAHAALPSPTFAYTYRPFEYLAFELSNALRSDAVFSAWNKGRADALEWIAKELRQRLFVASSIVDGLRAQIGDRLFAWPPKLVLEGALPFAHPELSRLAFVVRYECLMGALAVREQRAAPWDERVRDGVSIPLRFAGGARWELLGTLDSSQIEEDSFLGHLLVPYTEAGDRAQMAYDDHRNRQAVWAPRGEVRLTSVDGVEVDPGTGAVTALELGVRRSSQQDDFEIGDEAVLHPRFTDWIANRIVERLSEIDAQPDDDFLALVQAPASFATPIREPAKVRNALAKLRDGLTPSQERAFEQLAGNRLTLVWGPPGTGKTHFVARAVLRFARARAAAGLGLRVGVTAFTHAATENLLREIADAGAEEGAIPTFKLGTTSSPRGEGLPTMAPEAAAACDEPLVVFGGTVHAFRKASLAGLAGLDLVIVDEASQLKLGELALATMALGRGARLMLAGDDLQLPPIVHGTYPEPEDGLPGLQASAFEYLRSRDPDGAFTCQLLECWRMNETLCALPAETLYGEGFQPATSAVRARSLALSPPRSKSRRKPQELASVSEWLLDPAWPLALCMLEGVRASVENEVEAALVAELAVDLRARLLAGKKPYRAGAAGDRDFWTRGLFVVSPHHAQIRAIKSALAARRVWESPPFVDTVDKMQGQQCDAVIVSYGVSDGETALSEASFLYSRNRLNVSLTRAKSKCVVFLPQPLLEPSFDLLSNEDAASGLAHMLALHSYCREHGEERRVELASVGGATATLLRCRRTGG